MKIGIICSYPIPMGMAATTRIFAYSKSLAQNNDVTVASMICRPDSKDATDGVFHNVKFTYLNKAVRSNNQFRRIANFAKSFLRLPSFLSHEQFDYIIVSSDHLYLLGYIALINIILRKKLIFIFDEFPIPIRKKLKNQLPAWKQFSYKIILKGYDGYISMTKTLLEFYQKIHYNPGVIVSSITDTTRFDRSDSETLFCEKFNITYTGNMELAKDNIDNILRAIALLSDKRNFHLYLYGRPSETDLKKIKDTIAENALEEFVTLSAVSYNEIPAILAKSSILVSSQPDTKRAMGGFPTKLGEYLMAGKPVLLTRVGEIDQYFKDHIHVYFANPDDPKDFALKLEYIMDNYTQALTVANAGRQLIIDNYSHISAGEKIISFLKSIK